ncbi:MAG: TolC family protein, partial [Alphaproteobacteria bacterium]|nr:TolC family protein [Alphaproteobacteria bacterium]
MKQCLPVILGLSIGLGMCSGMASAQSLEDALAMAYANNPELAAGRAALRATDEQVPQALSNWRPTVSVSGSVGASVVRNPKATTSTNKSQHRNPRSSGVTLDQPLYRGGRTVAATKEALNKVRAARASLISVQQGVLQGAVNAYVNVVTDQAVLELNINNEQVLQRQLEAVQDRFQVGEVTRTDVHQAEARLSGAGAERIQAGGNLEGSRAEYRRGIGESPGALGAPEGPTG